MKRKSNTLILKLLTPAYKWIYECAWINSIVGSFYYTFLVRHFGLNSQTFSHLFWIGSIKWCHQPSFLPSCSFQNAILPLVLSTIQLWNLWSSLVIIWRKKNINQSSLSCTFYLFSTADWSAAVSKASTSKASTELATYKKGNNRLICFPLKKKKA